MTKKKKLTPKYNDNKSIRAKIDSLLMENASEQWEFRWAPDIAGFRQWWRSASKHWWAFPASIPTKPCMRRLSSIAI